MTATFQASQSQAMSLPLPAPRADSLNPASTALFLDFDGTLVPLADHPQAVSPSPRLPSLLQTLSFHLQGALGLITGRALHDLAKFLPHDHFHAAGQHGAEWRWANGHVGISGRVDHDASLHAGLMQYAKEAQSKMPGLFIEDKNISVGLHYRHEPDAQARLSFVMEDMLALAGPDYEILGGNMVMEIKRKDVSKGAALRRFMTMAPFAQRKPVMIGDEIADEHGFIAAHEYGGFGILVGAARPTAAQYHLPDVAGVHAWLEALILTKP